MFKHLLYNDKKKIIFCYVPKGEDKGTDFLTLAYECTYYDWVLAMICKLIVSA